MNISKSRIKTLDSCPLLFKWQYLDHRVPDIPPANVTKIGTDIHKIFNDFYDNIKLESIPFDEPLEYFKSVMTVLPQYQNIFNLFCGFTTRRWKLTQNKDEFMPVFKEYKIINDCNGSTETGIVDCVHVDNGNYAVLDYKSSASNPANLRFELNFYAKLLNDSKILDKPVAFIGVYGYKTGDLFYENINTKSYNLMLCKIEKFRNNNWENMLYPKTPGFSCSWCQYLPSCNKV